MSTAPGLQVSFRTLLTTVLVTAIGVGIVQFGRSTYDHIVASPVLTLPAEVKGKVGEIIPITATGTASDIRWHSTSRNLHIADRQYVNGTSTILVTSPLAGTYTVTAHGALHNKTTDIVSVSVIVGDPGPGPGPGPDPKPPEPPAPIPGAGLKVMIVYDEASKAKLPKEQQSIIYGTATRTYLNTHCASPDSWRMWRSTSDTTNEDKIWQDAFAKAKGKKLPYIIISNGKTGFEGDLPANEDATLTLLKTYETK